MASFGAALQHLRSKSFPRRREKSFPLPWFKAAAAAAVKVLQGVVVVAVLEAISFRPCSGAWR